MSVSPDALEHVPPAQQVNLKPAEIIQQTVNLAGAQMDIII